MPKPTPLQNGNEEFFKLESFKVDPHLHLGDEENGREDSGELKFELENDVDSDYPAILIVKTGTGDIDYSGNRVLLNNIFLGYLNVKKTSHVFHIHRGIKKALKKENNTLSFLSCDRWGDSKIVSNLNLDDFRIFHFDVCYKPR